MKTELLDKKTEQLARANEVTYGLELLQQEEGNAPPNPLLATLAKCDGLGAADNTSGALEDQSAGRVEHPHIRDGWFVATYIIPH